MYLYSITIFDHVLGANTDVHRFLNKRTAMQWIKENAVKKGYDYYDKNDQSRECRLNF